MEIGREYGASLIPTAGIARRVSLTFSIPSSINSPRAASPIPSNASELSATDIADK